MNNPTQHRSRIPGIHRRVARAALAVAILFVLTVVAAPSAQAQTFTTYSFDGADGSDPHAAPLVQATNGSLYGTTYDGGANGDGTVYKITPEGTLTTLYSFCSQSGCTDGQNPEGGLTQATDGNFYGTTRYGGANSCIISGTDYGCGTVFEITPSGKLTTLYSFCPQSGCTEGAIPLGTLIQATDGNFYGTTALGGANCVAEGGCGTVFRITPGGTLTTLYSFCLQSGCTDGDLPKDGLVQGTDGNFYGTAGGGGADGYGTVFKITPEGTLTTLYSFCSQSGCTDGEDPWSGPLVQAVDGNFYGTTAWGGANASGTVFKITPSGTLTTLYSFCSQSDCTDGQKPETGLIQATDGNFYGTTYQGGVYYIDDGTVFAFAVNAEGNGGTLTTLHSFDGPDGSGPKAALVQATDGSFYGATQLGGTSVNCSGGCGTVFSLSVGLGPFVKTLPTSGRVKTAVQILGTDLTGATSVSFNGTAAKFKVVSPSSIATTVPTGASSGFVTVITPGGTLTSNVPFGVQAPTTTTLTSSPNPSTYGEAVTFAATVAPAPPDGETVSFMKGKTVLGTGALSDGTASFTTSTLKVGTTSVKAVYGGDSDFNGSTSKAVKQVVDKDAE